MNKICTSVKQSRQLIKLGINIDTADMHYIYRPDEITEETIGVLLEASTGFDSDFYPGTKVFHYIPAWSLVALLNVLPKSINNETLSIEPSATLWHIGYRNTYTVKAENAIDACYQLIVYLHELKIL